MVSVLATRVLTASRSIAAITVNPATLPNGTVGVAYSQTVSATGGNGSYTFSVSAGSLPAGLSLMRPPVRSPAHRPLQPHRTSRSPRPMVLVLPVHVLIAVTINAAITVNPGDAAERHGRHCVLADRQCHWWQWFVYVQRLCRQSAGRALTEWRPPERSPAHRPLRRLPTSRSLRPMVSVPPAHVLMPSPSMQRSPSTRQRCRTARSASRTHRQSVPRVAMARTHSVYRPAVCRPGCHWWRPPA